MVNKDKKKATGRRSDGKITCLEDDGEQLLESEGSERGHGLGEEESDSASGSKAGLLSLPQDLLASILKDVAYSSDCKESQYSVGQHVEVEILENNNLKFENTLTRKSLVSGWWGATITSVVESGSEKMYKMYMIKWDELPAEHARRNAYKHWPRKSPWVGPFAEDQIRLHQLITAGVRRKASPTCSWLRQSNARAKIFTVQNTFPNYGKLPTHVLAASRAFQLSQINAQ